MQDTDFHSVSATQTKIRQRAGGHAMMEFAEIPGTMLKVSRVGLGTWAIGGWMWGGTDERSRSPRSGRRSTHGINVIDTAPAYGFGRSEEIVGKAIADGAPQRMVLSPPRSGFEWHDGKVIRNASRERITREIDDSSAALAHRLHRHLSGALARSADADRGDGGSDAALWSRAKIRAIGVSNFSVDADGPVPHGRAAARGAAAYNLFERDIEDRTSCLIAAGTASPRFGYGALCRGLLSGRMRAETKFEGDDLRRHDPKFQPPRFAQYLAAAERLDQLAQERYGKRVIHLAVRWVLDQGVTTALWGARRPDQLDPVDGVMGWPLDDAAKAEINRILSETITDPVGPEFMAPRARS